MSPAECRRVAQMYGATEEELDAAERRAAREPMTALVAINRRVITWPSPDSPLGQLVYTLQDPKAYAYMTQRVHETLSPEISAELQSMPYDTFLGTWYWGLVRAMLLVQRGVRCEGCHQSGVMLDAHHLTYAHRGAEVFHLEDLRLLCRACHERQHHE